MRHRRLLWILVFCQLLVVSTPTLAKAVNYRENTKLLDTISLKETYNQKLSKIIATPKGRLISSSGLQISDEGNGTLGVYAETLCHSGMKEIFMTIYLDVWNEIYQDWEMVDYYEYKWLASEHPDEELAAVSVSFDLTRLTRKREYRLRCYHGVVGFDNGSEMMSTETQGIKLD